VFMCCVGIVSPSKLSGGGDGVTARRSVDTADTAVALDCSN